MAGHPEDAEIRFLTGTYAPMPEAERCRRGIAELDLGCGAGSYAVQLARRFPERYILAADVMLGRLRKVVRRRVRAGVENNLAILRTEARFLIGFAAPDGSFDRIHLLCPDPWPKDRHRGHRLLSSDFTAQLHRVLKPEGIFHFSSDDEAYCAAVREVLETSRLFRADAPDPALEGIVSDFERRWRDLGRAVTHLFYRRLPLPPKTIGH